MSLITRAVQPLVTELTTELRVVIIGGPRQSGKTTLLRQFQGRDGTAYRSLDDETNRQAARDDPLTFARYGASPRLIDEVQRGGDALVRAIKIVVDEDTRPGRFILSGSSRFLTVPHLSESLAGRAVFVDLWPFSMAERTGDAGGFPAAMFSDAAAFARESDWRRDEYLDVVLAGGFPEPLSLRSDVARGAWYDGYLTTVINRDIRDFASVAHAEALPRLLALIAAHSGGISMTANLARGIDTSRETTRNYLSYLDMVYLTLRVPAWSNRLSVRLTKSPKLYPSDSGLAAHLMGAERDRIATPGDPLLGPLLETFVATELVKAIANTRARITLSHLRAADGREIDFILEAPDGGVVGIEVKATASPTAAGAAGLRWLRDRLGERFRAGILLHLGSQSVSFGDGILALPLSALWGHRRLPARP
ncbi:hypothetical protein LX16_1214 [Stackebrandtia albiflava]|uniref:ATP-binding protein n=1 Tax=Stackebrandtia albiflava TaxID=406432 RepID=A0A562VC87_9ACTN|nr:ATP-binding protein [Stackebrandtia albiflava]TWJ15503.1 hypothetical protein LX16_1214 [Stackebrandtia albiflava]